jgi:flagellar FliJ protein
VTSRDKRVQQSKNKIAKQTKRIGQIEALISELKRTAATLNYDIKNEEQRSQNCDPAHFAYSTFAVWARRRRVNIAHSMQMLERQLSALLQSLNETRSVLSTLEQLEGPPLSPEED